MRVDLPARHRPVKTRVQTTSRLMRFWHSQYGTLLLVLLLGLFGYWLAPADLTPGNYTAHVRATLPGQELTAAFPFTVGQQSDTPVTIRAATGSYQLVVKGIDAIPYALDQRLTYQVQVLDVNGDPVALNLDDVTSIITGPERQQPLPATQVEDGRITFTMRLPYKAKIALTLLFIVAALWLTELVPLSAAALLIPFVVVVTGLMEAGPVLEPFAHPIIILFLAGFLMAEAMRHTGLDRWLALTILKYASPRPAYLMLTVMLLTAFLSMWMSNTASVALILPIALAISDKVPEAIGRANFRRALVLSVAYCATIGGVGSAIGTPANMLALTFLNQFTSDRLTFTNWFQYGLPMTIIMVPVIWLYLLLTFRVKLRQAGAHMSREVYRQELAGIGRLDRPQWAVAIVFIIVLSLWLTEQWHGIPAEIVALGGALLLFFNATLNKESLNHINWDALLTFGGGLAIGTVLVSTGVSDWIALQLVGLAQLPPLLVVFLVASLTLLMGAFISNTACAAMLIPLAIPLAQMLQIDPRLLVIIIAISSSIDFALVVGTPPTMMAYATGLFQVREIFKRGLILDLVGLLLLSFGVIWIWRLLGAVTF